MARTVTTMDLSFMEDDYSQLPTFDTLVLENHGTGLIPKALNLMQQYGIRTDYLEDKVLPATYSTITANKGDDLIITTDNPFFGALIFYVDIEVLKLKVSLPDTGFSELIGNYAEEWVLTPIHSKTTFSQVEGNMKGEGIPFILDAVKLSYLSPVRKGSQLELDMESKLKDLAKISRWTNKNWFTFRNHQLMILMSTIVFDFNSKTFPFLTNEEGGSGAFPPWGNVCTVWSGLHFYHSGKFSNGILQLMNEAVDVMTLSRSPKDAPLLRMVHIAQSDPKAVQNIDAYISSLKAHELTELTAADLVHFMQGDAIPTDILEKAIILKENDVGIGAVLSRLRTVGLIMTETDLKVYLENQKLKEAIYGDINIGLHKRKTDEEIRKFKLRPMKQLQQLVSKTRINRDKISLRTFLKISRTYYKLKSSQYSPWTSLAYGNELRVFKRHDVEKSLEGDNRIALQNDFFGQSNPKLPDITGKQLKDDTFLDMEKWLENQASFSNIPIPEGFGTDDARIYNNLVIYLKEVPRNEHLVILLVSNDRQLGTLLLSHIKHTHPNSEFIRIKLVDYVSFCRKSLALIKPGPFYNYLSDKFTDIPSGLKEMIRSAVIVKRKIKVNLQFDFSNIDRSLERYSYGPEGVFLETTELVSTAHVPIELANLKGFSLDDETSPRVIPRKKKILLTKKEKVYTRWYKNF